MSANLKPPKKRTLFTENKAPGKNKSKWIERKIGKYNYTDTTETERESKRETDRERERDTVR